LSKIIRSGPTASKKRPKKLYFFFKYAIYGLDMALEPVPELIFSKEGTGTVKISNVFTTLGDKSNPDPHQKQWKNTFDVVTWRALECWIDPQWTADFPQQIQSKKISVADPWHFGVDPDPRIHASD
jgi:hypothetical protein